MRETIVSNVFLDNPTAVKAAVDESNNIENLCMVFLDLNIFETTDHFLVSSVLLKS